MNSLISMFDFKRSTAHLITCLCKCFGCRWLESGRLKDSDSQFECYTVYVLVIWQPVRSLHVLFTFCDVVCIFGDRRKYERCWRSLEEAREFPRAPEWVHALLYKHSHTRTLAPMTRRLWISQEKNNVFVSLIIFLQLPRMRMPMKSPFRSKTTTLISREAFTTRITRTLLVSCVYYHCCLLLFECFNEC